MCYNVGVLDPTTNKMMVYDTEYLLQPHIPGMYCHFITHLIIDMCLRVYYVGVLDPLPTSDGVCRDISTSASHTRYSTVTL